VNNLNFDGYQPLSLERLIVSGAVNSVSRLVSLTSDGRRITGDHTHRRDLYSAARPSRIDDLSTICCDTEYSACSEPLCHAGLSAAAETFVINTDDYVVHICQPFSLTEPTDWAIADEMEKLLSSPSVDAGLLSDKKDSGCRFPASRYNINDLEWPWRRRSLHMFETFLTY